MNQKLSLKSIAPSDLWNVFRGCVWFMVAIAIIVTGALYAFALFQYSPRYSSSATLYLIDNSENASANQIAADYNIAMRVMKDCEYLLKSREVLNAVGEKIGISNGYGALRGAITIKNPEDTRVLEVSVISSTPEMAQEIVSALCDCGIDYIGSVLAYDKLYIFEEASYNPYPVNGVSLFSYITYGAVAAVLTYVVFLAIFLFDNYIHTEEDIERYLGLTILGDIPDADAPNKKNKYKYKYGNGNYKSYRYYRRRGYRYHSNYAVNPKTYAEANANAALEKKNKKQR